MRSGKAKVANGLASKQLWQRLAPLCDGPANGIVQVRPELVAGVKFFGRDRSGFVRDGVLLLSLG